jgi:hypothetical protein
VSSASGKPQLLSSARWLGEQRCEVGTYLHEARADLDVALKLARIGGRRRLLLLNALTVGWSECGVERLAALPVLDERADMATLTYLRLRLRELYREAACDGWQLPEQYVLVVVETEYTGHRLVAETRLTTLHAALEYAFVAGESIVAITPRRAAVLAPRAEPRLTESLARLRSELKIALGEGRLPTARYWQQALPPEMTDLSLTLLGAHD